MDDNTLRSKIDLIERLSLAPLSRAKRLALAATGNGNVDAGSIVSFVPGVDDQSQQDVLNSTLIAQLSANYKVPDRASKPLDWYNEYTRVLGGIGWSIQNTGFTQYTASGNTVTMTKVILDVLSKIASAQEINVFQTVINALASLADNDGNIVLFDKQSHVGQAANFQSAVCSLSNGTPSLKLGSFYFTTTEDVTKILFWTYSTSTTQIYSSSQVIKLDGQIYGQVRDAIVKKLGKNAVDLVSGIDIGP